MAVSVPNAPACRLVETHTVTVKPASRRDTILPICAAAGPSAALTP
jgi:hypothetical protein